MVYIDGFNLYFGLRESGLRRFLWLDLNRFAHSLVRADQRLVTTKYFTARIPGPEDKRKRQLAYLEALGAIDPKMLAIIAGKYQREPVLCPYCCAQYSSSKEKMTDVNIAVEVLKDGMRDRYDTAILISGDSDQRPTIDAIHELWPDKRVVVAFPPSRYSAALDRAADASFVIGEARFRQNQFPAVFECNGRVHRRPEYWDSD